MGRSGDGDGVKEGQSRMWSSGRTGDHVQSHGLHRHLDLLCGQDRG